MIRPRWFAIGGSVSLLVMSGMWIGRANDDEPSGDTVQQFAVEHPECTFFSGPQERFMDVTVRPRNPRSSSRLSAMTTQVVRMLSSVGGTPTYDRAQKPGSIDSFITADWQANNITPAPRTTDWEFIRRVSLDLTGRIPAPDRVVGFVADSSSDKRAKLIDQLLASPEWVDKWTMYFGDLFQNTVNKPSSGLVRFAQGRNAFYQWIHDSISNNKPYNQMVTELITATGDNSYQSGTLNWLVGGVVTGGPSQDVMDQMTANVADTFLGITHVNCLLCHNGRGHLDSLSLWGSQTTRYAAWQLGAFLSRTQATRIRVDNTSNAYYWSVLDNNPGYRTDYALNTTTGNRPARVAPTGCKSGQPCFYVAPQYIFSGDAPKSGESYRTALARNVTGDFQFARAAVNYLWAQFFGRGMVDPPDTFDPARLDPANPPPAPWTLQPTNAALLNTLAQHFIDSGYDVKAVMREIANSDTYQLSSRYEGDWNSAWEPYFARKFVRRLWSEEVHDAVAVSSGLLPSYTINGFTDQGFGKVTYAMQLPDTVNMPAGDIGTNFLDSFLRGNRDDQPRKQDGSILQALNLMNNAFVEARLQSTGANAAPLITKSLQMGNPDLVNNVYLAILSRYPSSDEMAKAQATLISGNRQQAAQDLVWSLYNKVDFVFNY
ncbi:MAG: hypothetical protein C5B51_19835 [Terriglobia bacterium]|nr:MAG: hypothetical protein C5B51_19835 [Terriglobia bacterium]